MAFTVVTYHTPDFRHFVTGLAADCARHGYTFYCEETKSNYQNLIHAFDHKIGFLQRMVKKFGTVLWLDVECRIVLPVPQGWQSPLITSYEICGEQGLSSGVLMLGEEHLPFLSLWEKYAKKYPRFPDDFVLDFLTNAIDYPFQTVPFEFHDRSTTSPVVRGQWKNQSTILQHPTINRWPDPLKYRRAFNGPQRMKQQQNLIARQRKYLYFRNFSGDFEEVMQVMESGENQWWEYADWIFSPVDWTYAPAFYWPQQAEQFNVKPFTFQKAVQQKDEQPPRTRFRSVAIGRMTLDRTDGGKGGMVSRMKDWFVQGGTPS